MKVWIVIPVKAFAEGKSRLARALPATVRIRLNTVFYERTLQAVNAVAAPAQTLVVSSDPAALDLAARRGVATLVEEAQGLNAALEQASAFVRTQGGAVLSVSCDLPFLAAEDLRAMLAAAEAGAGVVIAGDRDETGTNALLIATPGIIPFRFGSGSFAAHVQAARSAGCKIDVIRRPGLAFDVDSPEDFAALRDNPACPPEFREFTLPG